MAFRRRGWNQDTQPSRVMWCESLWEEYVVCEGIPFAWLTVSAHASAFGSEAALAAAPGPT